MSVTQTDGYERAIRLLARREHSAAELEQKLQQKGVPAPVVVAVMARLQQQGLQCDQRFLESYLRSKISAGWGPLKLQAALRVHRISAEALQQQVQAQSIDWFSLAEQALAQRCRGSIDPSDRRERDKLLRFLCGRGFSVEQARLAYEQQTAGCP